MPQERLSTIRPVDEDRIADIVEGGRVEAISTRKADGVFSAYRGTDLLSDGPAFASETRLRSATHYEQPEWDIVREDLRSLIAAMMQQIDGLQSQASKHKTRLLSDVQAASKDAMFGLTAAYKADKNPDKVNLGVGAYKHVDGNPWVLPSVQMAKEKLFHAQQQDHEYLPIAGLDSYLIASAKLSFGSDSSAIADSRIASVQTISGTGALSLCARFLSTYLSDSAKSAERCVYVSQPPYVNHEPIMREARLSTSRYRYYSPQTYHLDFDGMIADLQALPNGSIVLLHACAHNPTAEDPTAEQWRTICKLMLSKRMVPLLDSAYQGFASGDVDQDAYAVRLFAEADFDAVFVAQSYAKNFGLYGERVGCLHAIAPTQAIAKAWLSQLERLQRVSISTPPAYGARVVALILNDTQLYRQWREDLKVMSDRIAAMRVALRARLEVSPTSTQWRHLTSGVGMFCYTGLSERQVRSLRDRHHIFMTSDARINVSGLNESNVDKVADAIKIVISESSL